MKEPGSDWLRMLDNGVRKALDINLSLRTLHQVALAALRRLSLGDFRRSFRDCFLRCLRFRGLACDSLR